MTTERTTERLSVLEKWLERINARCLYEVKVPVNHNVITCYTANGRVFIVTTYKNKNGTANGWDLYIPASDSNDIVKTLDAAALALGVDGCRGLVEEERINGHTTTCDIWNPGAFCTCKD